MAFKNELENKNEGKTCVRLKSINKMLPKRNKQHIYIPIGKLYLDKKKMIAFVPCHSSSCHPFICRIASHRIASQFQQFVEYIGMHCQRRNEKIIFEKQ